MNKKDIVFYALILILVALFVWQWISGNYLANQMSSMRGYNVQMQSLSGIGPLKSAHLHADVKVYINGEAIDFSQQKYQLQNNFIHFEDGVGDVVHNHATGLAVGHMFKSVGIDFNSNCIVIDNQSYCNDNKNKLKFYANGRLSNEFDNYVIHDMDKLLISYGSENDQEVKQQLDSVTNLAQDYSNKEEMELE